jgi:hypothetical protein
MEGEQSGIRSDDRMCVYVYGMFDSKVTMKRKRGSNRNDSYGSDCFLWLYFQHFPFTFLPIYWKLSWTSQSHVCDVEARTWHYLEWLVLFEISVSHQLNAMVGTTWLWSGAFSKLGHMAVMSVEGAIFRLISNWFYSCTFFVLRETF